VERIADCNFDRDFVGLLDLLHTIFQFLTKIACFLIKTERFTNIHNEYDSGHTRDVPF
jgi:hypothetical protein